VLEVMKRYDNVCNYLDIALQHIADPVLTNMRRHITKEETLKVIEKIRNIVPDIKLRTTLMVGFPGETEEAFKELVDFVREVKFDRMGAFTYSEEDDTWAQRHLSDDIPQDVKQERLDILMAAQEDVDIVWTGYAIPSIADEVNKGAYMPLDDLIAEYGKDMTAELESWVFDFGKVKNQTYLIPCYQMMSTSPIGLKTKKEFADKYLDTEKLKETFNAWETDPAKGQEFYDMLADYFQKLKDNGELGNGVGVSVGRFNHTQKIDSTTVSNFSVDTDTMKILFDYETEDMKLWYKNANDWYKKGYIREDILSVQNPGVDEVKNNYPMWSHVYYYEGLDAVESTQHGFPIEIIPLGKDWVIKNTIPATGTAIAATSKNPEKAMQLINLINSKKGSELYNLLTYGIEGQHYEKIGENRIKAFDYELQGDVGSAYGLWKWALGNTLNAWELEAERVGEAEYVKSVDANAKSLPTLGFKPDTTDVSVELSQIAAVIGEYKGTLDYGVADNWETVYAEFMEKVEKAGVSKVKEHLQKQLDEFIANK
jgi:putative aldouronate transport system substrate-binding protein